MFCHRCRRLVPDHQGVCPKCGGHIAGAAPPVEESPSYRLKIGGVASGPFTVAEIVTKLRLTEIGWETAACRLGGTRWEPLGKTTPVIEEYSASLVRAVSAPAPAAREPVYAEPVVDAPRPRAGRGSLLPWFAGATLLVVGAITVLQFGRSSEQASPTPETPSALAPTETQAPRPTRTQSPTTTPTPATAAGAARGIVIRLAPGSPDARVAPRGTPIVELKALPAPDDARLLAAATFEPSGAQFPQGIQVTWPLAQSRVPTSELWIVRLDRTSGQWVETGERAVVSTTGREATGRVNHFSVLGLVDRPIAPAVAVVEPGKPDEEKRPRPPHVYRPRRAVVTGHHAIKKVTPEKLAAVEKVYREWAGKSGGAAIPDTVMKEMYRLGGFETVKTLIENKVVSAAHSEQMADHRILMMFQTFEGVIADYAAKGRDVRVHRSDSGNQKAGMSSDVDQTIYVEEYKDGMWQRVESLDPEVSDRFRERFAKDHRLSVEALDIATIAGKDKFPDWRITRVQVDAEGRRPFTLHAEETLRALERTPGAYQECGAVVQQMQLRVEDLVERNLRQGKGDVRPAEPREMLQALRDRHAEFRLNQLAFLTIGRGDEADDRKVKVREAFRENAVRVVFDNLPPRLIAGHGYDAAVANYLEFTHHLHDKNPAVKYLLRALDDGFNTWRRLNPDGALIGRVEYASIAPAKRRAYLEALFGKDLAKPRWDGSTFLDRWQYVFDISAKLRDLHSAKKLSDATAAEVFRSLAEQMAGKDGKPDTEWRSYLDAARHEYDRRCLEFFMHNMAVTSQQRIAEWLSADPNDPKKRAVFEDALDEFVMRRELGLEGDEHEAKWKANKEEYLRNFSDMARLELLSTLRKLRDRPDLIKLIVDEAERKGLAPEDLARLKRLVWESAGVFLGKMKWREMPKLYARYYLAQVRNNIRHPREYAKSAMEHLAVEYGFVDTPHGPRPSNLLKHLGLKGLHERVTKAMQEHKLAGMTDRFLGNMICNIGFLQGASTVLAVFSESGGDPDETRAALINETLNLLPGIGIVKGVYDGGLDLKQQFLFVAGITVPAAGLVMATYAIGENGMVLYEHEHSRPLTNEVADALYRGYVGPSLYNFAQEGKPPHFDEEDEKAHREAKDEVARLTKRVAEPESTAEDAKALARAGRKERMLASKKAEWKAWEAEDNRYRGGAILGAGAQMRQKPLDIPAPTDPLFAGTPLGSAGPLFGRVKPVVFYARGSEGPVDFTVADLTPADKARLKELTQELEKVQPPDEWAEKKFEWQGLDRRQKAFDRAARYLAEAKTNFELLHQIQRDSLFPFMLGDDSVGSLVNVRNFVETWVAVRREVLPDALEKVGVNDSFKPWTRAVLDVMIDRLQEDLERSKRLWQCRIQLEKAKSEAEKAAVENEKGAYAAEVLMDAAADRPIALSAGAQAALASVGRNDRDIASLRAVSQAYLQRHIPQAPPSVRVGLRMVPAAAARDGGGRPDDKTKTSTPKPQWELRPDVAVSADPAVYVPPYSFAAFVLNRKEAEAAVASGRHLGLPLGPAAAQLARQLKEVPPPKTDKDPAPPMGLVFVFCERVAIPARIVPETVEQLPPLERFAVAVKGVEGKSACLFGCVAFASEPETSELGVVSGEPSSGPLSTFQGRSMRGRYQWLNEPETAITLKSQALRELEPGGKLCYFLERGPSADGPWTVIARGDVFLKPAPDAEGKRLGSYSTDIEEVIGQVDRVVIRTHDQPTWNASTGPFHRVTEARADGGAFPQKPDDLRTPGRSVVVEPEFHLLFVATSFDKQPASAPDSWDASDILGTQLGPVRVHSHHNRSVYVAFGGVNHGGLVHGVEAVVAFRGRTLRCRSERSGSFPAIPIFLPDLPSGESHPMTVSVEFRGRTYKKTFTVHGRAILEPGGKVDRPRLVQEQCDAMEYDLRKRKLAMLIEEKLDGVPTGEQAQDAATQEATRARNAYFELRQRQSREKDPDHDALVRACSEWRQAEYREWVCRLARSRQLDRNLLDQLEKGKAPAERERQARQQRQARVHDTLDMFLMTAEKAGFLKLWNEMDGHLKDYSDFREKFAKPMYADPEAWKNLAFRARGQDITFWSHRQVWALAVSDADTYAAYLEFRKASNPKFNAIEHQTLAHLLADRGDYDRAAASWTTAEDLMLDPNSRDHVARATRESLAEQRPNWWPDKAPPK